MSEAGSGRTLVLGLGNPLMADDGFGLAALAALRERWLLPPEVDLADGGTWGIRLLPLIEGADRLLVLDAITVGAPAGTPVALEGDELPRYLALKLSPHEIGLSEVLALATLAGTLPREVVALGAEPGSVEMSAELSPALAAQVAPVADRAAGYLRGWGHPCRPAGSAARSA
jgi:hydrogenase maturation protease